MLRILEILNPRRLKLWQIILLFFVVVVGLQQLIPTGVTPYRTRLDGQKLGMVNLSRAREKVRSNQLLHLSIGNDKLDVPTQDAGIEIDEKKTLSQLPRLSSITKIIPFAPLVHLATQVNATTIVTTNDDRLASFSAETAKKYTKKPVDATVVIDKGDLVVKDAQPGQNVAPAQIESAIQEGIKKRDYSIKPDIKEVPPAVTGDQFKDVRTQYAALEGTVLTAKYGESQKIFQPDDIRKLLEATKDPKTGKWSLGINKDALAATLVTIGEAFNIAPGTTQVTMVDDQVTSRVVGPSGRRLNVDAIQKQFQAWVVKPTDSTIVLAVDSVSPNVVYSRSYTKSSAALQAKIDAWVKSHSGSYQIAIRELNGQGRAASVNVAQQTVMASTYKLFVAFAIYHQAENGALSLATPVLNGQTVEQCISKAIINSDNDCAIALGKYVGWAKADQIVADAGFQNVKLNNYDSSGALSGDKMVNANELAKFLSQLSAGSLMNSTNTAHLLGYMKSQTYRDGIPAGSHGSVVADKVGFLEGYLHDAGIVYSPKATYALVIMSSGSSWSNISSLADAIYGFMND